MRRGDLQLYLVYHADELAFFGGNAVKVEQYQHEPKVSPAIVLLP